MKNILLTLTFIMLCFNANAACKFDLEFGEDASKVENRYGLPMPMQSEKLSNLIGIADEVCPNQRLKDVAIDYRFINNKLAAINLVTLNSDDDNKKSDKITLMKYAKRNYGDFDTGQNPTAYVGFEVFEKGDKFIVYQRVVDGDFINEQLYISTVEFDKLLGEVYAELEEAMGESENKN